MDEAEDLDDAMGDDARSSKTNPGGSALIASSAVDKDLLTAAMVRCCICGIMT